MLLHCQSRSYASETSFRTFDISLYYFWGVKFVILMLRIIFRYVKKITVFLKSLYALETTTRIPIDFRVLGKNQLGRKLSGGCGQVYHRPTVMG